MRIVSFGLNLSKLVLVDDDVFPDGRGELWVTSFDLLQTAVLNSWNSVSCLTTSLFSSIILAFNVWSILF